LGQKPKGLINTAAASALGRMLNKYCQREGVPLLNVVRRKEQAKILEEEGAKFILDTSNEGWVDQYNELLKTHGFNVLFDAIGGGEVTEKLISHLLPGSQAFIYGKLTSEPFTMRKPLVGLQGTSISNFMLFEWYARVSQEQKDKIKKEYSSLLKKELSTNSLKRVTLEEVPKIWAEAEKNATEGKFTILV
jgi:NADPH2:quinone reductase